MFPTLRTMREKCENTTVLIAVKRETYNVSIDGKLHYLWIHVFQQRK